MKKRAVKEGIKTGWDWGKIALAVVSVIAIILLFTLMDYFTHLLSEKYAVPPYYFKDKIIFGIVWGLAAYFIVRKKEIFPRSLIISAFVAVVLQVRYYFTGYPLDFVLLFLVLHFIMLFASCLIVFKVMKKWLK